MDGYRRNRLELLLPPDTIGRLRALAEESGDTISTLVSEHIHSFIVLEKSRRLRASSHPLWGEGVRCRIVSHLEEQRKD